MVYVSAKKWPITWTPITWSPTKEKKFWFFLVQSYIDDNNLWVKIPNTQHMKICLTFRYIKKSQKSSLNGPANGQLVTYSKIQISVCKVPYFMPIDWFLMKSVNVRCPLQMCQKMQLFLMAHSTPPPLKCVAPSPQMVLSYSLVTCPP